MFRRKRGAFEVLLAHPGGPFFARKDDGVWTIPKGEAAAGEDLLTRAQIEFEEEVGFRPGNVRDVDCAWLDYTKRRQNCACLGVRRRFARVVRVQIKFVRNGMAAAFR